MHTATFSEFIRQPTRVLERAAGGDIRLTRRGEADLMVSTAARHDTSSPLMEQLTRLLVAALDDDTCDHVAAHLQEELPWIDWLPQEPRRRFVGEYFRTARACAVVCDFTRLGVELDAWKETARAYAAGVDPEGSDLTVLDEPVALADPTA